MAKLNEKYVKKVQAREKGKARPMQRREPVSPRELIRLMPGVMLRAMVVILPLTILMAFMGNSGVTVFNNFWVQTAAVLVAYMLFYNFIFGPLRKGQPSQTKK